MNINELTKLLQITSLPQQLDKVEKELLKVVSEGYPDLRNPSVRLIKAGGKRLRPFLVIAASSINGEKTNNEVIKACSAIELIHIGTLVHDDIIDNASTRWGVKTVNADEGVSEAILVGDYLLALASSQAASINKGITSIVASTIAEMCSGQAQEKADTYNIDRSVTSYKDAIKSKTAALMSASCRIGAMCGNLLLKQVEALSKYGQAFGMAFQITDDLLDILSTDKAMGKPVNNDIKEGVYTLPILLGLKSNYKVELMTLLRKRKINQLNRDELIEMLEKCGALEATLNEIRRYNKAAVAALKPCGESKVAGGLKNLPDAYLDWALQKQSAL